MQSKSVLRIAFLVFFAFSFGACDVDRDTLKGEEETASQVVEYNGVAVTLDATAVAEDSEPRALYSISGDGQAKLVLPSQGVDVHCLIRSTNPNSRPTYITLRWRKGEGNTLEYTYEDRAFNLASGSNPLAAGSGDWYIMGIIGGKLDASTGKVAFAPGFAVGEQAGATNTLSADVPYIFPWTKLDVVEVNGQVSLRLPSKVRFMRQGVLLRHHITNEMYTRWRVSEMRIISNVMSFSGSFSPGVPKANAMPTWEPVETLSKSKDDLIVELPKAAFWEQIYKLANRSGVATPEIFASATQGTGVNKLAADNKKYYITWAMPGSTATTEEDPFTGVYLQMQVLKKESSAAEPVPGTTPVSSHHTFFSSVKPQEGLSYRLESVIRRPTMVLEYMAETNLSGDKTFAEKDPLLYVDEDGQSKLKYYNLGVLFGNNGVIAPNAGVSAENLKRNIVNTMPIGYHLPILDELRGILGSIDHIGLQSPTSAEEAKRVGWKKEDYYNVFLQRRFSNLEAMYVYNPENETGLGIRVAYALRWKHSNAGRYGTDMQYSAWRYEYITDVSPESYSSVKQGVLQIKARYLGPGSTLTIDEVAKEDWWKSAFPPEDEVVRILPLGGYMYDGQQYMLGKHGVIMLETTYRGDINNGDLSVYRPERNGVRTNSDVLYYNYGTAPTTPQFPYDVEGKDYPQMASLRWSKLSLPIRPFKDRTTRTRFK